MNKHHIHATRLCAIWLTAASLLAMPASLRAQSYQKLWESVTQAEQTDRPRTTRNLVDKIIQKHKPKTMRPNGCAPAWCV